MITDRIEGFINRLLQKTNANELPWKAVRENRNWKRLKTEILRIPEIEWKDYVISEEDSYCMERRGGYVLLITVCYGNAKVFSGALDKLLLVLKIDENTPVENLCSYGAEGVYQEVLQELRDSIEQDKWEKAPSTEALCSFMDKVLEEEE